MGHLVHSEAQRSGGGGFDPWLRQDSRYGVFHPKPVFKSWHGFLPEISLTKFMTSISNYPNRALNFLKMVYFRSYWSDLDISTAICLHPMAPVGFGPMTLGYMDS